MNIIRQKKISRRTLLRGAGVAIGLPYLDAMTPALGAIPARANRIAVIYVPNGIVMKEWQPPDAPELQFTRILKPLEPFREDITVVSGLVNQAAGKARGGGHAKASGSFLSGMPTKHTAGSDVRAGVTFDQLAAQRWADQTRLPSLQLGCEDSRMVGNCDTGSSCAYTNCLSWRDADSPMMVDVNPRSVFERLFGNIDWSLAPEVRSRRAKYRKSILDVTRQDASRLNGELGASDRRKVDQYLTSIREVELRIGDSDKDSLAPSIDKPAGIPFDFGDYVRLMFDLQVIAFQADLCRVSTIMLGREGSVRTYPEIGVTDPHHPLTHHRGHPDFIEKVTKINCYHTELFAYFLDRLKKTEDGEGSLLDGSSLLYGGGISDGNSHSYQNLPLLVAGGAGGRRGGRHVAVPAQPVTNLYVELLNSVNIPTEVFGDSTGRVDLPKV